MNSYRITHEDLHDRGAALIARLHATADRLAATAEELHVRALELRGVAAELRVLIPVPGGPGETETGPS